MQITVRQVCTSVTKLFVKQFDLQNLWPQFSTVLFAPSTFLSSNWVIGKIDHNVWQQCLFLSASCNGCRVGTSFPHPSQGHVWSGKQDHEASYDNNKKKKKSLVTAKNLCRGNHSYLLSSLKAEWVGGSHNRGKDDASCIRDLWISFTERHSWNTGAECGFGIKGSQSGQLWRRLALE